MSEPTIFSCDRLDLFFEPRPWDYARAHRAEIDAFFAKLQHERPAIWNGRVLLLHRWSHADGVFRGAYLETDFASFSFWRAQGRPPADIYDCFGAAAILTADGAALLGVMGPHTANAGRVYFPCGTPDPDDVIEGKVDLDFSVARELEEETGLAISGFIVAPGWTAVMDGGLIAQVKLLRSALAATELRARILAYLAREERPELSDIRVVRSVADFAPAMPGFVTAFLSAQFKGDL